MNRKQKIIVSVTGIFLVLLLLVGLTYAYFLTKINGNNNSKSILVSTANLALVYGDGNGDITATNIQPGDVLTSKTFTVTNDGNDTTSYIVVIDNATSTFNNNDFVYTLTCTSDGASCTGVNTETTFPITGGTLVSNTIEVGKTHTYSLTVTYKDTGVDQSIDMGKTFTARVNIADPNSFNPYAGDKTTLAYNIINNAVNVTNEQKELGYTEYRETPLTTPALEISKLELTDKIGKTLMPYSKRRYSSSWKYADVEENAMYGDSIEGKSCSDLIGKYIYDPSPAFNGTEEGGTYFIEGCQGNIPVVTGQIYEYEQILSQTSDNYGTSYYYRGQVTDNYVNFAGMCWRIVRIEGDGSIKLLLENQNNICENHDDNLSMLSGIYGYKYDFITNSSGLTSSEKKYTADYINNSNNLTNSFRYKLDSWLANSGIDTSKLKKDEWCLTNPEIAYDSIYNNANYTYEDKSVSVSLKCEGNNYINYLSYIGTLTADEVIFAGAKVDTYNNDYWMVNTSFNSNKTCMWSTLTLRKYADGNTGDWTYGVNANGTGYFGTSEQPILGEIGMRPSITLRNGIRITKGDGTISNPYVIE